MSNPQTTTTTESAKAGTHTDAGPRVRIDKADGPFVPVLRWLLDCPVEAKLAAVALTALIDSDVQNRLKANGLYDGQIGTDLRADWLDAVFGALDDEALDPTVRIVASFFAGVEGNYSM